MQQEFETAARVEYARLKHANRVESIAKLTVAVGAVIYASGFLIVFTFLERLGIRDAGDLFKAKYIHVGVLYWLIPVLVGLPLYAYSTGNDRYKTRNKDLTVKEIPVFTRTSTFVAVQFLVFLYIVILLAPPGFVPEHLWLIGANCALTFIGIRIINTLAERFRNPDTYRDRSWSWRLECFLAKRTWCLRHNVQPPNNWETVRYIHLVALIYFDVLFCFQPLFSYILPPLKRGIVMIFVFLVAGIVLKRFAALLAKLPDEIDKTSVRLLGISIAAGCSLFTMVGFAYAVYPYVPSERGGGNYADAPKVALTLNDPTGVPRDLFDCTSSSAKKADTHIADHVNRERTLVDPAAKRVEQYERTKPLTVIEQTSSWVYVAMPQGTADPASWKPEIVALRVGTIQNMYLHNDKHGNNDAIMSCETK